MTVLVPAPGLARLRSVPCPLTGRPLVLRRAWPRAADHLLLQFLDEGNNPVAAQWFADPDRLDEATRATAATGPAGKVATPGGGGVLVQREGADRRLRRLAPALEEPGATLVVHRPERRAVVRRARLGITTYRKLARGRGLLPAGIAGVRTPEVLVCDPAGGVTDFGELPGVSLYHLLGDGGVSTAEVAAALVATGEALRSLHRARPPAAAGHHGSGAEAAVVERWLAHAEAHSVLGDADLGRARSLGHRAGADLADLPVAPRALVHRDLHDKQVLVAADDEVGLLDLDTLAVADPALDLANLLVHLELRVLQGHSGADRAGAAAAALLEGYRPESDLVQRLGVYALATRVRLVCVYAFRPRWSHLGAQLLAAA